MYVLGTIYMHHDYAGCMQYAFTVDIEILAKVKAENIKHFFFFNHYATSYNIVATYKSIMYKSYLLKR